MVDQATGETTLLDSDPDRNALDEISRTFWGTVLFAEESNGGPVFEIILDNNGLTVAVDVIDHPAVDSWAATAMALGQSVNRKVNSFTRNKKGRPICRPLFLSN